MYYEDFKCNESAALKIVVSKIHCFLYTINYTQKFMVLKI